MDKDKILEAIEKAKDQDIAAIAAEALIEMLDRMVDGNVQFNDLFLALDKRTDVTNIEELKAQFEEWVNSPE